MRSFQAFSNRFISLLFLVLVTNNLNAADRASYTVGNWSTSTPSFDYSADTTGTATALFNKDIDGDGDWDLFVSVGLNNAFPFREPIPDMLLLNQGDNSFVVAEGEVSITSGARESLLGDFNDDGILDLFLADQGYDAEPFPGLRDSLLLGSANGFVNATDTLPTIDAFSHNAAMGDVDNDGDLDIFAMNNELGDLSEASYLLINDGSANFELNRSRIPQKLVTFDPNETQSTFAVEFGDMNGDGWTDLIIGRRAEKYPEQPRLPSRIHWNNGDGSFSDENVTFLPQLSIFDSEEEAEVLEVLVHDVDNDGRNDVLLLNVDVVGRYGGRGIQLLINKGDKVFADETVKRLGSSAQNAAEGTSAPFTLNFLDVNGDGIEDILPQFSEETSDDNPIVWEGTGYGCFNPISLADISNEQADRNILTRGIPVISDAGIRYTEVSANKDGENNFIQIGSSADLIAAPLPRIANEFDACSGFVRSHLDAGDLGLASLDFSIYQTEPTVIIQAKIESVKMLTDLPENPASFDGTTGQLVIPTLMVNDEAAYSNLQFNLIDGNLFLFELSGSD